MLGTDSTEAVAGRADFSWYWSEKSSVTASRSKAGVQSCLIRYLSARFIKCSCSASMVLLDDKMITETLASRGVLQMNCSNSSPSNLGIIRSRIRRSGSNMERFFSVSSPSTAGTTRCPACFRCLRYTNSKTGSSSANKMVLTLDMLFVDETCSHVFRKKQQQLCHWRAHAFGCNKQLFRQAFGTVAGSCSAREMVSWYPAFGVDS